MSKRSYMKEAIDIIESQPTMLRPIIIQILKDRPSAIVKAYKIIEIGNTPWLKDVLDIMRSDGKIAAIKQLRTVTDLRLIEAKEKIEELQTEYEIKFT